MLKLSSIEADVDIAHIDYILDDEVVACLTIEIRKDMITSLGSANDWKEVFLKTIQDNAGLVALKRNIQ